MNVAQLADQLRRDNHFMKDVTRWEVIPARPAKTAPFPESLDPRLIPVLAERGIHSLYTHQAKSLEATARGEDVTVVTPTASGKTMCYNLPVLSAILQNEDARALYLFPTKALSADQVSELYDMIEGMGVDIKTYTYDGDTPAAARKAVRQAGHIVVTNPDMLHSGILPHHTKWVKLFENLRYIVIDEIHTYRGVFGSNLANVLRRLMRLCDFYGSHPQFILCSATIANPQELAEHPVRRNGQEAPAADMGRKTLRQQTERENGPEGIEAHLVRQGLTSRAPHPEQAGTDALDDCEGNAAENHQKEKVHQEEQQGTLDRRIRLGDKVIEEDRIIEQVDALRQEKDDLDMAQDNQHEPAESNAGVHVAEQAVPPPELDMQETVAEDVPDVFPHRFGRNERQVEFQPVLPGKLRQNPENADQTVPQHEKHPGEKRQDKGMETG